MNIDRAHYSADEQRLTPLGTFDEQPEPRASMKTPIKHVSLALQGGGSFGAFTWGVVDRLLQQDGLKLDMISGASAGAMNAVVMASGLAEGGPDAARLKLERFWHKLASAGPTAPAAAIAALELSSHLVSPYQFNPLGLDPLRDLLVETVDFERLRADSPVRLLIAATRVKDGRLRLFREHEITVDAVLASACLPLLHHTVEIDGEGYWDGGFSANPPLRQLALDTKAEDILLVQIMPEEQEAVPHSSIDISRRAAAIAFNASLHRELQALEDLRQGCGDTLMLPSSLCRKLTRLRLHRISAPELVAGLDHESMLNTARPFLDRLHASGRLAADGWLAEQGLIPAAK